MTIKAITTDFWDTIAFYPFTEEIFDERVDHAYGIFRKYDITFETAKMLMKSIYEHFENIWHNHNRTPTTPEMFRRIEDVVGYRFSKNDFSELVEFNEKLIPEKYFHVSSATAEAIRHLSGKFKIVIISDTGFEPGREIRNTLDRAGLLKFFHYCVFSDETGYSKPDERAFRLASEKTGCRPEEMIHIGDRENKDISGARASGMKTLLFTGFRNDDKKDTTADFTAENWQEVIELIDKVKDNAL